MSATGKKKTDVTLEVEREQGTASEATSALQAALEHSNMPGVSRPLPSGRTLAVRLNDSQEQIEVVSPQGEVEVRIVMTDEGPVVKLCGVRLEIEAEETVAVNCRNFEVNAEERAAIVSGGPVRVTGDEMRVRTRQDVHMNGAFIRLNCPDSLENDPEPVVFEEKPKEPEAELPINPAIQASGYSEFVGYMPSPSTTDEESTKRESE
ncbi:hypothetical protein Pan216_35020 [Planctomycetes bacterium Pan216]|uniref:Uncharacterized protein n=1 Tax=Kolteria novifilia TaxID=2527975 RepID=A0A518B6N4_9BACT|nr:hypothetical protein Pan216_35020 [Planctomycetes bacterium Pan216]